MLSIFQSASVALADARRDMSFAGHKPQKPPHMDRLEKYVFVRMCLCMFACVCVCVHMC